VGEGVSEEGVGSRREMCRGDRVESEEGASRALENQRLGEKNEGIDM
jgi:hypothetical protein